MTYTYNLKSIGLFVLAFFLVGSLIISQSFAQDPDVIPSWIKNNAGWWANDNISD